MTSGANTNRRDLSGAGGSLYAEQEPNDTLATAQTVPAIIGGTTSVAGAISPSGDIDVYAVAVPPGAVLTLTAVTYGLPGTPPSCGGIDTVLAVYDAAGARLGMNDDANGTMCSQVTVSVPGGTAYVEVRAFTGTIGQYFVDITLQ